MFDKRNTGQSNGVKFVKGSVDKPSARINPTEQRSVDKPSARISSNPDPKKK